MTQVRGGAQAEQQSNPGAPMAQPAGGPGAGPPSPGSGQQSESSPTATSLLLTAKERAKPGERVSVTIFGAGITGLSAAHELAERGFLVNVVEPESSLDCEYEVEVGGIARTQWGRVPPAFDTVFPGPEDRQAYSKFCEGCLSFRAGGGAEGMWRTQKPYGTPEVIRLVDAKNPATQCLETTDTRELRDSLLQVVDEFGVRNATKVEALATRLGEAMKAYFPSTLTGSAQGWWPGLRHDLLEKRETLPTVLLRLGLIVQVRVHGEEPQAGRPSPAFPQWAPRIGGAVSDALAKRLGEGKTFVRWAPERSHTITEDDWKSLLEVVYVGAAEPVVDAWHPDAAYWNNRVTFRIVERRLPGEHGYRFFPTFYRNLFDTMRRTPLLEPGNLEGTRTAMDQLVKVPWQGIAREDGRSPIDIPRRRATSFEEMRQAFALVRGRLDWSETDVARFQLRLFRYLTSCSRRREKIADAHTWASYINKERYSEPFRRFLEDIPQALIAMSASEVDARTHGNATAQLLLDYVRGAEAGDAALSGPTSTAWLRWWKRYLVKLGVRFFQGKLEAMELHDRALRPRVSGPSTDTSETEMITYPRPERNLNGVGRAWAPGHANDSVSAHYYVLAVEYPTADKLVASFVEEIGSSQSMSRGLRAFTRMSQPRPRRPHVGSSHEKLGSRGFPTDQLRWFSGVQFFFTNALHVGNGHTYFVDSGWGLSSIAQDRFWRSRFDPSAGILSSLSVDLGSLEGWRLRLLQGPLDSPPEWNAFGEILPTHARGLAESVWRDVARGLGRGARERNPWPAVFHVDEALTHTLSGLLNPKPESGDGLGLTFPEVTDLHDQAKLRLLEGGEGARAAELRRRREVLVDGGPGYLINDHRFAWSQRPGLYADRPAVMTADRAVRLLPPADRALTFGSHEAERRRVIEYEVMQGQWVLAGGYAKTYTRISTMESSNESARHAVNAILRDLLTDTGADFLPPAYAEFCDVWDPEDNELDDLTPFKRLDEALLKEDLPHFMDILNVEGSFEGNGLDAVNRMFEVLEKTRQTNGVVWRSAQALEELNRVLKSPKG